MPPKIECPVGETFGGYVVIEEGPPDFNERQRWRVQCTGCGATCVRDIGSVKENKVGCVRCRNKANAARARSRRRPKAVAALRKAQRAKRLGE